MKKYRIWYIALQLSKQQHLSKRLRPQSERAFEKYAEDCCALGDDHVEKYNLSVQAK